MNVFIYPISHLLEISSYDTDLFLTSSSLSLKTYTHEHVLRKWVILVIVVL